MSYLVDHHLAVADPFGLGHTAPQLGLMTNLTQGLTFPWTGGGVALLRRRLYPAVGGWMYVGLAVLAQSQIGNYPGLTHSASQAYQYAAVRFLGNGFISPVCEPIRIDFDSGGTFIQPLLPAWPINPIAEPLAGGKFRVHFAYDSYGQGASPTDFQVFAGATPATVDYGTPLVDSVTSLNVVAFVGSRRAYTFTTAAFTDQTAHVFGVRARNSGGVAELNTFTTPTKTARNKTPVDAAAPIRARVHNQSRKRG